MTELPPPSKDGPLDWAVLKARAAQTAVERVARQRTRLTLAAAFGIAALVAVAAIFIGILLALG